MKTVTIDISEPVYKELEAAARQSNRVPAEVIRDFLERELAARSASTHSILSIPSFPLGPPSHPWTSRAEMLEGFMDDRGD